MDIKPPQKTEKPWGYELLFACTDKYAGKVIFIRQGHRLSHQYHEKKDETMYIYEGRVEVQVGTESAIMTAGQCIAIPPLTRHRLKALEDSTIFEVSTPELQDVKRLADDYGRAD